MKYLVKNAPGLIGDFIGLSYTLYQLWKEGNQIYLEKGEEMEKFIPLFNWMNIDDGSTDAEIVVNINEAFSIGSREEKYMAEAFHNSLFPNKEFIADKNGISFKEDAEEYDLVISPFSRSLPSEQKWSTFNWLELISRFPDKRIGILANTKYDDIVPYCIICSDAKRYDIGDITIVQDRSLYEVAGIVEKSLLVSVVTGTAHLSAAVGGKNILLTNQGVKGWGIPPSAICIDTYISQLSVGEVENKIREQWKD